MKISPRIEATASILALQGNGCSSSAASFLVVVFSSIGLSGRGREFSGFLGSLDFFEVPENVSGNDYIHAEENDLLSTNHRGTELLPCQCQEVGNYYHALGNMETLSRTDQMYGQSQVHGQTRGGQSRRG